MGKLILKNPSELKLGDVIIGARVNYRKHESDDADWTTWDRKVIIALCERGCERYDHSDMCRGSLERSHDICEFLVERVNVDGMMHYEQGKGWVYG